MFNLLPPSHIASLPLSPGLFGPGEPPIHGLPVLESI